MDLESNSAGRLEYIWLRRDLAR